VNRQHPRVLDRPESLILSRIPQGQGLYARAERFVPSAWWPKWPAGHDVWTGLVAIAIACIVSVWTTACSSPTAPAANAGNRVAGAWLASATLGSASGGECVGATLQASPGRREVFTVAIRQDGNALEATVASQGNGTLCAYSGSVNGTDLTLQLTSCQADRVLAVACGDGQLRDVQLARGTISASANPHPGTASAKKASSWNVSAAGAGPPLGRLSLTADFNWIFLGLPSSDYHVFTGTIFPGYADGTISIPADPNPFCVKCGWFVAQ